MTPQFRPDSACPCALCSPPAPLSVIRSMGREWWSVAPVAVVVLGLAVL